MDLWLRVHDSHLRGFPLYEGAFDLDVKLGNERKLRRGFPLQGTVDGIEVRVVMPPDRLARETAIIDDVARRVTIALPHNYLGIPHLQGTDFNSFLIRRVHAVSPYVIGDVELRRQYHTFGFEHCESLGSDFRVYHYLAVDRSRIIRAAS